jgi:hypothetical protein
MFAKTITGKGFGGTIDYAFYGKKESVQRDENGKRIARGEVIGGTVSGVTRRELMNDFQTVKDLKPDKMKPMAHHILAFAPEDEPHLTDNRMNEIAASYMEKKGYSEKAVYAVIKHEDTDNKHLHIIAATTETDGRGIFLARTKDKDLSQQLERENNLREVERPESESKNEKPPKFNELQMVARTGEPSAKMKSQEAIKTALEKSKRTTEFLAHLKESGTNARFNVQSTGRIAGISFETDGVIFKGSSLGKDFSWNGLQKQGLSYEPERDFKAIEAAKQEAEKGINTQGERANNGRRQNSKVGKESVNNTAERGIGDSVSESSTRSVDAIANADDSKRISEKPVLIGIDDRGITGTETTGAELGRQDSGKTGGDEMKDLLKAAYVLYQSRNEGKAGLPQLSRAEIAANKEKIQMREKIAGLDDKARLKNVASLKPASEKEVAQTKSQALKAEKNQPPAMKAHAPEKAKTTEKESHSLSR